MSSSADSPSVNALATPLALPNGTTIKNRLAKAAMSEQLGSPAHAYPLEQCQVRKPKS